MLLNFLGFRASCVGCPFKCFPRWIVSRATACQSGVNAVPHHRHQRGADVRARAGGLGPAHDAPGPGAGSPRRGGHGEAGRTDSRWIVGQGPGRVSPPVRSVFCESCNRVRLTFTGQLFMCLGRDDAADLRSPVRVSDENRLLDQAIAEAISRDSERTRSCSWRASGFFSFTEGNRTSGECQIRTF